MVKIWELQKVCYGKNRAANGQGEMSINEPVPPCQVHNIYVDEPCFVENRELGKWCCGKKWFPLNNGLRGNLILA